MGGNDGIDDLKECEKFSLSDDVWRPVAQMGLQRNGCSAVSVPGYRALFVFGGNNHYVGNIDRIEKYEVDNDKWILLSLRMMEAALDIYCLHLGKGRIMIMGGHTEKGTRMNIEIVELS